MSNRDSAATDVAGRFGMFEGVFVPTTLTILGVILFLRTGWVVGQTGLLGAWLVIGLAFIISTATALSLSSIVTNMRVGPGGAFSVITRTLGIELGGSIGLPLFLSQALAVAMYIFGFREGWRWIFPGHSALIVDLVVFGVLFGIAFLSARLAFRLQYAILGIIGVAVFSLFFGLYPEGPATSPTWWNLPGPGDGLLTSDALWLPFAVFFPAVTGIMAGTNMSGELKRPDRSIPRGTLYAIGLTFVIYIAVATVMSVLAPMERLAEDKQAMIDLARWSPLVLGGLLAATFSSGLSTMVGAPRIIQALGQQEVVPGGSWVGRQKEGAEPRNALLLTGVVVLIGIAMRDLNAIAELLTLFFLLTYATINAVLLAQELLGTINFRPGLEVPLIVPSAGLVGCTLAMLVISPAFALLAFAAIVAIYLVLLKRDLSGPYGEVRSGFALAATEWAVRALSHVPPSRRRTWQANLLVPATDIDTIRDFRPVMKSLGHPNGSVMLLGLGRSQSESASELENDLLELCAELGNDGLMCRSTMVHRPEPMESLRASLEVLKGAFMRPNLLFLPIQRRREEEEGFFDGLAASENFEEVLHSAQELDFGLCLYTIRDRIGDWEPHYDQIDVWFTDLKSDDDHYHSASGLSLVLLTAWKLSRDWGVNVRFLACSNATQEADEESGNEEESNTGISAITPVTDADQEVRDALQRLVESARLKEAEVEVFDGDLTEQLSQTGSGTLVLVGGSKVPTLAGVRNVIECTQQDCLFVCRSGTAE